MAGQPQISLLDIFKKLSNRVISRYPLPQREEGDYCLKLFSGRRTEDNAIFVIDVTESGIIKDMAAVSSVN